MTDLTDSATRSRPTFDPFSLERNDRLLLAGCAVAWLAALGAAVAAVVALIDLGRGHVDTGGGGTPWVLYVIIAVSAAVIVAAVPLLLRARRTAEQRPERAAPQPVAEPVGEPVRGADAATEKLRVAPAAAAPSAEAAEPSVTSAAPSSPYIDQIWFRCATSLVGAMGVAVLLIGVSTYLLAVGNDTVAWVLYAFAGVVTVAMVAIPWYFVRELGATLES
ncbi:DUF2561 family protein [Mycobacterium sp. SMC-4]|uniref:DUF2561 family protein n=1 Tax=Mycobacterium sp. SMC-4 TaxID=2857059 RepID=UPI0021B25E4F|nr:DUF2561 family protein [Mycobacterium sp. SMC-4]UXA16255.1 DUF2561 family protein [Mycobacterium sp. SMC-4]